MSFQKVEITNVDTSKLKVLSEKECFELLKKAKAGDKTARNNLINGNLRLVLSIVQRFKNRNADPDDLFQVGCIGLMKACDNFNLELDVKFSTYAVPMIMGEIKRYLRDNTYLHVPRSMRDTAYHAMHVKEKLQQKNNREPTIDEIAAELGIGKQQVITALESIVAPVSLYEPVYSDNGDELYIVDQVSDVYTEDDIVNEISVYDAINSLTDKEKEVFRKRFLQGKTQTEVAVELSVSQAQVSRIEKSAKKKILQ